jgi:hypothetical protein
MASSLDPGINAAVDAGSPATLVAHLPLRVVDVSSSGCLFESDHPVEPGRVGTVRLALNGGWYVEDVRVTRCEPVPGHTSFHVGAEFLKSRRLSDQSLRLAVTRMTTSGLREERPVR